MYLQSWWKRVASAWQIQLWKRSFENSQCCNSSLRSTSVWTSQWDCYWRQTEKGLQQKLFNHLRDDTCLLQLKSLHILPLILRNLSRKGSFIAFIGQIRSQLDWWTGVGLSYAKCKGISVALAQPCRISLFSISRDAFSFFLQFSEH